jgi:hypothetical protein
MLKAELRTVRTDGESDLKSEGFMARGGGIRLERLSDRTICRAGVCTQVVNTRPRNCPNLANALLIKSAARSHFRYGGHGCSDVTNAQHYGL